MQYSMAPTAFERSREYEYYVRHVPADFSGINETDSIEIMPAVTHTVRLRQEQVCTWRDDGVFERKAVWRDDEGNVHHEEVVSEERFVSEERREDIERRVFGDFREQTLLTSRGTESI